jgi:hypothetical protein
VFSSVLSKNGQDKPLHFIENQHKKLYTIKV